MIILYCIGSFYKSGGTERVLATKMNYLSRVADMEIHLAVQQGKETPFFCLSPDIHVHYLREVNKKQHWEKLKRLITKITPDIIVSTGGNEFDKLPKLKGSFKTIYEFHYTKNFLVNFVKGFRNIRFRQLHIFKCWLIQKRIQRIAKRYNKVVVLTKRDTELWGNPENMTYIYDPLSFKTEKTCDYHCKNIISVGSLTPSKGMDLLIDAFAKIARNHKDWKLTIYGEGQDKELLNHLIEHYNLTKQVIINNHTDSIQEKMLHSSIYAFPSRSDGFGLVLTEAMECGLPCVAFDCPCGPREIIDNNETGFIIREQDVESFAKKLECLMENETLRKEMGGQGKVRVKRFYPESIMPQWIKLINHLLHKQNS